MTAFVVFTVPVGCEFSERTPLLNSVIACPPPPQPSVGTGAGRQEDHNPISLQNEKYIDNELRHGKVTPQNFFAIDGAEWYHGSDRPPQRTARFLPWQ